jgi:hypothetical protein
MTLGDRREKRLNQVGAAGHAKRPKAGDGILFCKVWIRRQSSLGCACRFFFAE